MDMELFTSFIQEGDLACCKARGNPINHFQKMFVSPEYNICFQVGQFVDIVEQFRLVLSAFMDMFWGLLFLLDCFSS